MNRAHLAYFAQDLIGDALVWVNQAWMLDTVLVKRRERLCETTIFCTKGVAELFRCFRLFQRVVEYDPAVPWSAEEARGFGHFDLVANSRYDADSAARVEALDHDEACGFENIDIPEAVCKRIYDRYVPLSRWNDFHLRRETSVTEQGAELIRLYDPEFHEDYIEIGKSEFVREAPEPTDRPRIVFVLGASDSAKSWGLENFLAVARSVKGRGFRPLFLLGPGERGLAPRVAETGFEAGVCLPFRKIRGTLRSRLRHGVRRRQRHGSDASGVHARRSERDDHAAWHALHVVPVCGGRARTSHLSGAGMRRADVRRHVRARRGLRRRDFDRASEADNRQRDGDPKEQGALQTMNTILTALAVFVGGVFLFAFGLGAVAAIARFAFDCLKGVFKFGSAVTRGCLGLVIVLLLFLLFIAIPAIVR